MKAADLRAMTVDQLDDEALKAQREQFNLRFQRATNQLEIRRGCARCRRDIRAARRLRAEARRREVQG